MTRPRHGLLLEARTTQHACEHDQHRLTDERCWAVPSSGCTRSSYALERSQFDAFLSVISAGGALLEAGTAGSQSMTPGTEVRASVVLWLL